MKLQSAVLSLGWQQKRQTWDTKISKAWPEMQKKTSASKALTPVGSKQEKMFL